MLCCPCAFVMTYKMSTNAPGFDQIMWIKTAGDYHAQIRMADVFSVKITEDKYNKKNMVSVKNRWI